MCCFMGMVTMTYWSLSQKKVARNKHKKLGMRFRYSTCLNQISLNNLRKSTFSSMSVSANQNTASSSIVCSKYLNLCSRQFNFVGSTVIVFARDFKLQYTRQIGDINFWVSMMVYGFFKCGIDYPFSIQENWISFILLLL